MSDEVHMFDEGTIIRITITEEQDALDLTEATTIKIKFERKDRSTFIVDGEIEGDPTLGIIYCESDETFFTIKGTMTVQVYLEFANGKWHTSKGTFTVSENIVVTEPTP